MSKGERGSVLVVEDDAALAALLTALLAAEGFSVVSTESRETALVEVRERKFEVAVVDLGLPPSPYRIEEGVRLIEELSLLGFGGKVVVLTGQGELAAARAAIRSGAFDFLVKPCDFEVLVRAVERAILFVRAEEELTREGVVRVGVCAPLQDGMREVSDQAQERLLRQLWRKFNGNVAQIASALGMKRENVYYYMKKFGIVRE
ncbi:MAG: response regulator [Hydrogenophilus sp.]|nr:response regulator [Hydrogenophilus sp.]